MKNIIKIINNGYDNYLGRYNIEEMINEEKKIFYFNNGDYINPKLEITFDRKKGIKVIAKDNINKGEYILVEKSICCCRIFDPNNDFESANKIQNPLEFIGEIEYIDCIHNFIKILKKSPLDYKEFFILFNGENLNQNYEERIKKLPNDLISLINIELIEKIFKYNKYTTIRYLYYKNKIGVGLWKYFSLFNHSCLPNTTNLGIGDFIIVTANRQIKKGEEITVLYFTTPKYKEYTKNIIKNIYNFECDYPLCEMEKKSKEKYPELIIYYDEYINKLKNSDKYSIQEHSKNIGDFISFLGKNKNILSYIIIGKGYFMISKLMWYKVKRKN